jgi:hypothetical protein
MTALIRKFARIEIPPLVSNYNVHPFTLEPFEPVVRGPHVRVISGDEYGYWMELAAASYALQHFMKPFKIDAFGTKNIMDMTKSLVTRTWYRKTTAGFDVVFFMERIDKKDTRYPNLVCNHKRMPTFTSSDWNIMGQVDGWIQTSTPDRGLYDHVINIRPATAAELV